MATNTASAVSDAAAIGVGGITILGVSLPDVVLILTIIYTLMRIGDWFWEKYRKWKDHDE